MVAVLEVDCSKKTKSGGVYIGKDKRSMCSRSKVSLIFEQREVNRMVVQPLSELNLICSAG